MKSNHEICGALEFDEGDASGAWIEDEAQVGNGAQIGSEMEDQTKWVDDMGQRCGTAMKMKISNEDEPRIDWQ